MDELLARGGSHTGDLMEERRPGGHCPRDGAALARATVGGRTTWWCPAHQALSELERPGRRLARASASSTLAAWPSARTLYQARRTTPLASTRKVDRMVPMVFLPYMVFSPHAP